MRRFFCTGFNLLSRPHQDMGHLQPRQHCWPFHIHAHGVLQDPLFPSPLTFVGYCWSIPRYMQITPCMELGALRNHWFLPHWHPHSLWKVYMGWGSTGSTGREHPMPNGLAGRELLPCLLQTKTALGQSYEVAVKERQVWDWGHDGDCYWLRTFQKINEFVIPTGTSPK